MTVKIGDMQSIATLGWWVTDASEASAPSAPTITAVNDGDGDAITVTVAGDAGATHTVYYAASDDVAATAGESRSGDGDINQAGLTDGARYTVFVVSSASGLYSLPSNVVRLLVTATGGDLTPAGPGMEVLDALRDLIASSATFRDLVGEDTAADAKRHVHLFGVDPPTDWTASTAYALGDTVTPATIAAHIYKCTAAGTTGASEPDWPTAEGETVADGTATWTAYSLIGAAREDRAYNTVARLARPYAVVDFGEDSQIEQSGYKGGRIVGSVEAMLKADTPAAYQPTVADAGTWFNNIAFQVFEEMAANANTPGYLAGVTLSVDLTGRVDKALENDLGDHFAAIFSATFRGLP